MALNIITRQGGSDDPLVPDQFRDELVAELPATSATLALARRVPLTSKRSRQPVLSLLPEAYWVGGDTGLKQTSKIDWKNSWMVAEELAVIVPVPEAYLDDAQIPIWPQVRPLVAEAFGVRIDEAVLNGTDKPTTWEDPALIPGAIAAGNVVAAGTGDDLGVDVANLGRRLAKQGYSMNGFTVEPGFEWRLVGMRGRDGQLIYGPSPAAGQPGTLYGRRLFEAANGAWDSNEAELLGGDWSKVIVGIRQDITFRLFTEGVITDDAGKVVLNLMQQDSVALRVVMRLGYALPRPVSRLAAAAARFPFGVLTPEDLTPRSEGQTAPEPEQAPARSRAKSA